MGKPSKVTDLMMVMIMIMVAYQLITIQSHSHQVGICHIDEGWEFDTDQDHLAGHDNDDSGDNMIC